MQVVAVFVAVLALSAAAPLHSWSLQELELAIQSPATSPELLPHLIDALNDYMEALWHGQPIDGIQVVTPAGVVPSPSEALIPVAPVIVAPTPVAVPPTPVVAPPTPAAAVQSSPLVEIIVNVIAGNSPNPIAVGPAVVPEQVADVIPVDPVTVVEEAFNPETVVPSPVIVVEQPTIVPQPGVVQPEIVPEPVIVVEQPESPVAGVPIVPVGPGLNPIDVIGVAAPEFNPIDVLAPVPVVPAGAIDGIQV